VLTHNVQEPAPFVVIEIRQVIRKIGEVIANSQPDSVGKLSIDTEQEAFAIGQCFIDAEPAVLEQRIPFGRW